MRVIATTYALVAALAVCGAALAQNNADQPSASSGSAQTTGQANSGRMTTIAMKLACCTRRIRQKATDAAAR